VPFGVVAKSCRTPYVDDADPSGQRGIVVEPPKSDSFFTSSGRVLRKIGLMALLMGTVTRVKGPGLPAQATVAALRCLNI
jgi:hypothetical protein